MSAHAQTATLEVTFIVPGRPQAKERPRVARGHAYTPASTSLYEARVTSCAKAAMGTRDPLADDGLTVLVTFRQRDRVRADIDNLIKSVMDGMSVTKRMGGKVHRLGPVMRDDSQVTEVRARLFRGADRDETEVMVLSGAHLGDAS